MAAYFVFFLLIPGFNSEVFSSTAHLSSLLNIEKEIVGQLEKYIENTEIKTDLLRRYIDEFKQIQTPSDVDEIVGNPLSAYQLLKRLTIDWGRLEGVLHDNSWQDLIQQVQSRREGRLMPHEEDLQGAALAILRLQETYRLNVSDLARGNILGIQSATGLSARDCLYLGKHCSYHGFYDLAIEWFDHALRMSTEESNPSLRPEEIKPYLEEAMKTHDLALESGGENEHTFREPIRGRTPAEIKGLITTRTKYNLGLQLSSDEQNRNYQALCRGEKLRSGSEEASLNCYLSDRGEASFLINPIKVEVHSHDPQLVTFHDVIYDEEINFIKEMSKPTLERSTVLGDDGKERKVSDVRTSQNTWLHDNVEDSQSQQKIEILLQRLSRVTGLNIYGEEYSEAMQVANYGIGGHYLPHPDYLLEGRTPEQLLNLDSHTGDRIATLMFYLSDVTRGGATVFPRIGAAVWPRKGSAAFWYNLRKNGKADPLTLHGACPVLHGSKWIGNKWIHELNQIFKRPCSLNPTD